MTTTPDKDTTNSDKLIQDQTDALREAARALVQTREAAERMNTTLGELKELVREDRPAPRRYRWFRR